MGNCGAMYQQRETRLHPREQLHGCITDATCNSRSACGSSTLPPPECREGECTDFPDRAEISFGGEALQWQRMVLQWQRVMLQRQCMALHGQRMTLHWQREIAGPDQL